MNEKKNLLVTIPDGPVKDTFVTEELRRQLAERYCVTYNETGRQLTQEEARGLLTDKDAVMTGWGSPMLDESVLSGNTRLKLIVHTGGTVGNLVDGFVYEQGIRVFSGNRLYAESVAEGVIGYMLTAQRRLPDYIARVRDGQWRTEGDVWEGLLDKTVGIIGIGTISTILIRMLQPFRVKIRVFCNYPVPQELIDTYRLQVVSTLDELFASCDIVSVHSALTDATRGMIRKKHFDLLRDNALFVNTARGDVVNEEEMIGALKENRFRAILDVYHKEPLPDDSPLRSLPNVYAVPHMGGPTLDRREGITRALIDAMNAYFDSGAETELEITAGLARRMTKM